MALALVGTAVVVPPLNHWQVHASLHPVRPFAPLAGWVDPRVGPGTPLAVVLGVAGAIWGPALAARLRWRTLLLATYAGSAAWTLTLAFVDGPSGLTHEIANHNEYLPTARQVHDVPALLSGFADRIPVGVPGSWPTHVAGHPPGALLLFVGLVGLGLGGAFASALVLTLVGCTTPVAVLVTLRRLGAEDVARRAVPFLVLAPAAIWVAVSADGVFAAVAAWGLAAVAAATSSVRRSAVWGWGVLGGLLLGCVPAAVLRSAAAGAARPRRPGWRGASWRPLPAVALGAVAPVLGVRGTRVPAVGGLPACCTTATGRASRRGDRRRTGSGATSRRWLICGGPGPRRRRRLAPGRRAAVAARRTPPRGGGRPGRARSPTCRG